VQGVLTAVQALPAVILKDPAVKSALLAVQAFAGSVQGAEAQAVKAIESIPVVKQLQAELSVLAKVLQPYAQAASAKMNVEALVKQLPLPMQVVEKEMVKMAQGVAEVIHIISRDGDKDLFNGYPFNPQALVVRISRREREREMFAML